MDDHGRVPVIQAHVRENPPPLIVGGIELHLYDSIVDDDQMSRLGSRDSCRFRTPRVDGQNFRASEGDLELMSKHKLFVGLCLKVSTLNAYCDKSP